MSGWCVDGEGVCRGVRLGAGWVGVCVFAWGVGMALSRIYKHQRWERRRCGWDERKKIKMRENENGGEGETK